MSSFLLKFCSSFGNRTSCRPILSVIILVINKSYYLYKEKFKEINCFIRRLIIESQLLIAIDGNFP